MRSHPPVKEAAELESHPTRDLYAAPQVGNRFDWHVPHRGAPPPSPYANGIYHGRIILPATYPLKPPNFRFLTPTGRFEVNREICLSISGHHEETWQPAWGIRTALVAIRSFMDSEAKGQVGGLECDRSVRERMAGESGAWRCATCAKCNAEILKEREEACAEGGGEASEEVVPDELRLAYRDELDKTKGAEAAGDADTGAAEGAESSKKSSDTPPPVQSAPAPAPVPRHTRTGTQPVVIAPGRQQPQDRSLQWIDTGIYGIVAALVFLVLKKFAS